MIEAKTLKAPDGFSIEKSWERNEYTGQIKPDSIVYTVYTDDGGIVGSYRTLKEAHKNCK